MSMSTWPNRFVRKLAAGYPAETLARYVPTRKLAVECGTRGILIACIVGLSACVSLPLHEQRTSSAALDAPADSSLGRLASNSLSVPTASGFQILPISHAAMAARIALANRAEKTLDVQYYELAGDATGRLFLRALHDAAIRGVRVRVLIDDLHTVGEDALLSSFAATPNVEVRLFNPFPAGRSSVVMRFIRSWNDLRRVDHRMHNKLFIADNIFAIMGGRNIAGEYFLRKPDQNFLDIDLLAAGAITRDLSKSFDTYWNSAYAYPIGSIVAPRTAGLSDRYFMEQAKQSAIQAQVESNAGMELYEAIPEELNGASIKLIEADARVVSDLPEKIDPSGIGESEDTVRREFVRMTDTAHHEVVGVSPYFIPGRQGMAHIKEVLDRGVRLRIFTNSLASNDAILAHIGYARYRRRLLKLGVELYELNPALPFKRGRFGDFGASRAQLHAKLAMVDRKTLFMGSMNLDNRSANLNTEVAIIVDSPELCGEVHRLMDFGSAYHVRLTSKGDLEWVGSVEDYVEILHDDPDSTEMERLEVELLSPIMPEGPL